MFWAVARNQLLPLAIRDDKGRPVEVINFKTFVSTPGVGWRFAYRTEFYFNQQRKANA